MIRFRKFIVGFRLVWAGFGGIGFPFTVSSYSLTFEMNVSWVIADQFANMGSSNRLYCEVSGRFRIQLQLLHLKCCFGFYHRQLCSGRNRKLIVPVDPSALFPAELSHLELR
jgi:hypothetical protein